MNPPGIYVPCAAAWQTKKIPGRQPHVNSSGYLTSRGRRDLAFKERVGAQKLAAFMRTRYEQLFSAPVTVISETERLEPDDNLFPFYYSTFPPTDLTEDSEDTDSQDFCCLMKAVHQPKQIDVTADIDLPVDVCLDVQTVNHTSVCSTRTASAVSQTSDETLKSAESTSEINHGFNETSVHDIQLSGVEVLPSSDIDFTSGWDSTCADAWRRAPFHFISTGLSISHELFSTKLTAPMVYGFPISGDVVRPPVDATILPNASLLADFTCQIDGAAIVFTAGSIYVRDTGSVIIPTGLKADKRVTTGLLLTSAYWLKEQSSYSVTILRFIWCHRRRKLYRQSYVCNGATIQRLLQILDCG